ncbi:Transglycosylase SLT family protein [Granulibacter bethesdensis]|uniref:Transglycosylase SLT family protein n=2 Tax=Granulibacter bethesdensis TaxID=364410 RepID=Q0BS66_GRABC|nr:Transglycosylase SLT family protein [Granulibacter bethesdensis CGDNIH1]AHJ68744.1 Transglycosylase SLT family protein [Granulibacter bethesdensis]APH52165.1 Transglycosylase SLT family protein [Granulibacter bethesdensis]APH64858.1 Transglycosylase SLT family protein [Granulibacter bethesdensis]
MMSSLGCCSIFRKPVKADMQGLGNEMPENGSLGLFARRLGTVASLGALCALAACGGHSGRSASSYGGVPYDGSGGEEYGSSGEYTPPGPPSDPWGPYIKEASQRFSVPESWIRAVMRQESAGRSTAVSSAGAMGLLQLMPGTYSLMRDRYHLGDDPYDPHNNVLAGTAYIREMYDQYGSPGFLAAYNAGPGRLASYLNGTGGLPGETVNYVSIIAPRLGGGSSPATSAPVMVAQAAPQRRFATTASSSACDSDAAYDPSRPCQPGAASGMTGGVTLASYGGAAQPFVSHGPTAENCDKDSAFDPSRPCRDMGAQVATGQGSVSASALPPPVPPYGGSLYPSGQTNSYGAASSYPTARVMTPPTVASRYQPTAPVVIPATSAAGGGWSVQVGAFASRSLAQTVASGARNAAPALLHNAQVTIPTTAPFGGNVLYRARLTQLTAAQASQACNELSRRQLSCMVVPPGS